MALRSAAGRVLKWRVSLLLLAVAACGSQATPPIGYCTAPRSIALQVTVLDSVSRTSRADSAYGVVHVGAEMDSLRLSVPPVLEGGTKVGTYQITIDRPQYREWTRANVIVSQQGPCGNTIPVQVTALLQLAP